MICSHNKPCYNIIKSHIKNINKENISRSHKDIEKSIYKYNKIHISLLAGKRGTVIVTKRNQDKTTVPRDLKWCLVTKLLAYRMYIKGLGDKSHTFPSIQNQTNMTKMKALWSKFR